MDMTTLYRRNGSEFTGKPQMSASGKPFTLGQYPCTRCGGAGGADKWKATGWTCFDCSGSGKGAPKVEKLYTREQLAKLDAAQAKRDAVKAAKQQSVNEARALAQLAAAASFDAANQHMIARLPVALLDVNNESRDASLLRDLLANGRRSGAWSAAQLSLVSDIVGRYHSQQERVERSQHVGAIGEKIAVTVVCVMHATYERPAFGSYGRYDTDTVHICQFEDAAGNVFVTKTPSLAVEKGARGVLKGSIKSHDVYREVKQTVLQRAKFVDDSPVTPQD